MGNHRLCRSMMFKNSKKAFFVENKGSGNPENNFIENLRDPFFPNLVVSMCANFHQDQSGGLACASDTDRHTHRQTHTQIYK